MPVDLDSLASLRASAAALTRVARTGGAKVSAPARAKFLANFETEHRCRLCGVVKVDQSLPPEERAKAALAARRAHMTRMRLWAIRARRLADAAIADADQAEAAEADELAARERA
jgi:hypothetical protein